MSMVIWQCDGILNKYKNAMLFNEENLKKYCKSLRKVSLHDTIFLNVQLVESYFVFFLIMKMSTNIYFSVYILQLTLQGSELFQMK